MNFHCIADEDTVRGFRLAGVSGEVVTPDSAAAAVKAAAARPDCGILILGGTIAEAIGPLVDQIRYEQRRPLIVEIAGPEGQSRGRKSMRQIVQAAVGIRLETRKGS